MLVLAVNLWLLAPEICHRQQAIACVQNDPLFAPSCPEGHVHAFASNACFAVCDDAHPCSVGACAPWQGGGVCI